MLDFSIVIPTFNSLELLKRALSSVIYQKDISFEIIIVDDSTNNEIEDYVNSLELNTLRYIHNIPGLGAVNNWNFGISLSNGKNVLLLHHDECLCNENSFLYTCMQNLNSNYEIIISNIKIRNCKGEQRNLHNPFGLKKYFIKYPSSLFFLNLLGPVSCFVFKKSVFENFDVQLKWYVDVDWYYRLLKKHRFYLNENLWIESFHGHSSQITQNINILTENEKDKNLLKVKYKKNLSIAFFLCLDTLHRIAKRFLVQFGLRLSPKKKQLINLHE